MRSGPAAPKKQRQKVTERAGGDKRSPGPGPLPLNPTARGRHAPNAARERAGSGRRAAAATPGGFVAEAQLALPGTSPPPRTEPAAAALLPAGTLCNAGEPLRRRCPGLAARTRGGQRGTPGASTPRQGEPSASISRAASTHPSAEPPAAAQSGAAVGPFHARRWRRETAGLPLSNSRPPPEATARHRAGTPTLYARLPSLPAAQRGAPSIPHVAPWLRLGGVVRARCGAAPCGRRRSGGRERAAAARRDVC